LIVLDEVQQYIGESAERSTQVTEVVEALSKQLDSHVMVIAAGQSALTEVRLLNKLMDRFTIRVPLSDADVETVTRKVLLQKKPTAVAAIKEQLELHAGEISRNFRAPELRRHRAIATLSSKTTRCCRFEGDFGKTALDRLMRPVLTVNSDRSFVLSTTPLRSYPINRLGLSFPATNCTKLLLPIW
jgi:hypothetical protein